MASTSELAAWLAGQPHRRELTIGGKRLLLVHSTPWEPRGAYVHPGSTLLAGFAEADADFVLYGHTHQQLVERIGRVLVINPGSAGDARDPRNGGQLSCAVLDTAERGSDADRLPGPAAGRGMKPERQPDLASAGDLRDFNTRYFEDYVPGAVHTAGAIAVTESEIVEFARRYDPQPMHIDPDAAARGRFGGLIASGWHTGAMMMRLFADNFLSSASSLASPGLDELRWHLPVRPGDTLSLRVTIIEARPSRKNPEQGVVRSLVEVLNQNGAVVMSLQPISLVRRRPAASAPAAAGE